MNATIYILYYPKSTYEYNVHLDRGQNSSVNPLIGLSFYPYTVYESDLGMSWDRSSCFQRNWLSIQIGQKCMQVESKVL